MESTDKNFQGKKIGIFDSGIGGFSVLGEMFKLMPEAQFYYISDDAHAPYGPKSDEYITERAVFITQTLIQQGVDLIVVACNTATAASIDFLRDRFNPFPFVGVEPFLNAYYKMPEGLSAEEKKMVVLTTESMGKSNRFKRLKERLDPSSEIDHYSLKNLARIIDDYYYHHEDNAETFQKELEEELTPLKNKNYAYAILGCTHYPLVKDRIEAFLNLKAISPDAHVAQRVFDLTMKNRSNDHLMALDYFYFYSSKNNQWIQRKRASLYGPFKGK